MRRWVAVLAVVLLWPGLALVERRLAMVVGNGAYAEAARLTNPPNDARRMEAMLRERLGFEVIAVRDGRLRELDQALDRFAQAAQGADVALFFYAGHGMEHEGQNRLVPVDALLEHERDVEPQTLAVDQVLRAMQGARVKLLLLDACRNNPLAGRMLRSAGGTRDGSRGLAPVENAGPGTVIAFATGPGRVDSDGTGSNSPFTTALLAKLPQAGEDIRVVLGDVSDMVESTTGGRQSPWTNFTGLRGRFLLAGAQPGAPAPPQASQAPVPPQPAPAPRPAPQPTAALPARGPAPPDDCDRLAQPPRALMGPFPTYAEGIDINRMDGAAALAACERAAQRWAEEMRFTYQRARALSRLGRDTEAERLTRAAADQGYTPAITSLAVMYEHGRGVAKNEAEAARLYRLAASQGFGVAQAFLGYLYATGRGVPQSDAEAVRLYRLAVEQGLHPAQNNLGLMYEHGRGVPANLAEAVRLYRLAARQGNADAQGNLSRLGQGW